MTFEEIENLMKTKGFTRTWNNLVGKHRRTEYALSNKKVYVDVDYDENSNETAIKCIAHDIDTKRATYDTPPQYIESREINTVEELKEFVEWTR